MNRGDRVILAAAGIILLGAGAAAVSRADNLDSAHLLGAGMIGAGLLALVVAFCYVSSFVDEPRCPVCKSHLTEQGVCQIVVQLADVLDDDDRLDGRAPRRDNLHAAQELHERKARR